VELEAVGLMLCHFTVVGLHHGTLRCDWAVASTGGFVAALRACGDDSASGIWPSTFHG
jgi:hypothetical protein